MKLTVHSESAQTIKSFAGKEDQKFQQIHLSGYINTSHEVLAEDEILFGASVLKINGLTQTIKDRLNEVLNTEPIHLKRKANLSSNINGTVATITIPELEPPQLDHETVDAVQTAD